MSLSKKEQFIASGLELLIKSDSFEYSYGYLEKGKIFRKTINLIILGESLSKDLLPLNKDGIQKVAIDSNGEIYECLVVGNIVYALRDAKSIYKQRKKKGECEDA